MRFCVTSAMPSRWKAFYRQDQRVITPGEADYAPRGGSRSRPQSARHSRDIIVSSRTHQSACRTRAHTFSSESVLEMSSGFLACSITSLTMKMSAMATWNRTVVPSEKNTSHILREVCEDHKSRFMSHRTEVLRIKINIAPLWAPR